MTALFPNSTFTKGTTFIYSVKQAKTGFGAPNATDDPFQVVISDCLTDKIDVEPLYESTNSDAVGHKVVIELSGIAHGFFGSITETRDGVTAFKSFERGTSAKGFPVYGSLVDSDVATQGPGASSEAALGNVEQILSALATPRGRLQYAIGDTIVYAIASGYDLRADRQGQLWDAGVSLDYDKYTGMAIDQTPKVTAHVTRVISDTSVHLSIKAEFHYQSCHQLDAYNGAKADTRDESRRYHRSRIKSLRWWFVDDIDGRTWYTRRVIRGRLELLDREVNPHLIRRLVLPPIQRGFRRESIGLAESEDGMSMDFEIVDQELYAAPPWPVSDWDGSASLTFPPMLVGPITANCDLTLTAPRHVPKPKIIALMIRMFNAKLHWYRKTAANSVFTEAFNISESMIENVVSGSLQLKFIFGVDDQQGFSYDGNDPAKQADNMYRIIRAVFGNDMSFDPNRNIDPFTGSGFSGGSGPNASPPCPDCLPPTGPATSDYGGHVNGIRGYARHQTNYWRPDDGPLKAIVRCALQNPCEPFPPTPASWDVGFDSGYTEDKIPPGKKSGSDNTPRGVDPSDEQENETGYLPTVLTRLGPLEAPYFSYELSTSSKVDTGVQTFNSMGPLANNSRVPSTSIAHQTQSPAAEVTIKMDASRLSKWPKAPNELNFVDPRTQIGYICKGYSIYAQNAKPDALGANVLFKVSGEATYVLTRAPKFNEPIYVAAAPFIQDAIEFDPTGNVRRITEQNYLDACDRKEGNRFRTRDLEDICVPGDNGSGEEPETPVE